MRRTNAVLFGVEGLGVRGPMGIVVPVPLPAGHDALSVILSSRERKINPVREPVVRKGKGPATGDQSPWARAGALRSGEWGSSARLGVGTSVSRDRGEGLIEAESSGGFRVVAPNPAAGRLASEAAAFPQLCCFAGGAVQLFPWRRDETRDQRSTTNPRRNESRRPVVLHQGGEGCGRKHGICRLSLECTRQSAVIRECLLDGRVSSRTPNQERLGRGKERRSERHSRAGMASVTRQIAVSRVSLAVQAFLGPAY